MPKIVTATDIIKHAGKPTLRDLARVDDRATKVDQKGLGDGGVEVVDKLGPMGIPQLGNGRKPGEGEADVKGHASPGHVGAVELGMPWKDNTTDAQKSSKGHVDSSADGITVKGGILGCHNGSGDEEGYSGVVDAGENGNGIDVGYGVHSVPYDGAAKGKTCHEEEDGSDDNVSIGAHWEVGASRVKVKGDG